MSLPEQLQQLVQLLDAGHFQRVEAEARDLTGLHPQFGYGWKILGLALQRQGASALAEFRKASQLLPKDHESQLNLANALMENGQPGEAMRGYRRALKLKPDDAQAHCGLGNALMATGEAAQAVLCHQRALKLAPDSFIAFYNLGNALQRLDRLQEAEAAYRRAAEIQPDFAEAHYNLGNTLHDLGQLVEAAASFRRAVQIRPDYLDAHGNLLLNSLLLGDRSPAEMLARARRFGELAAQQARPFAVWRNSRDPGRRLRIGLVSGDLRNHPVGFFVQGVVAALQSRAECRLELHAYHNNSRTDELSERIRASCRGWHPVAGLSDQDLAGKIRDDGIDILLDLSGHTALSRLSMFALKPVPLQVSWLGYLGTTGVAAMDYLIADSITLPESEEAHFTEKIWRLPDSYICFTPPAVEVPVGALPAQSNGYVTFGSFNNLIKINDAVVALWARVLASVPQSRLFLKAKQLGEAASRRRVAERFAVHGIEPARLRLEGHARGRAQHLAAYQGVDIALDPFPYPGITTSVEALWMGVPLLTLAGERFLSRQGMGLLVNAGLPDWIAADAEDYVAKSVAYAAATGRLADLRAGLRQKVLDSPLFNAPRFAGHFEAALCAMWQEWCDRQAAGGLLAE